MNSLPKTVTRQRRDCDLNPGPSAPESSTLTTRLPSHPSVVYTHSHTMFRGPPDTHARPGLELEARASVGRCEMLCRQGRGFRCTARVDAETSVKTSTPRVCAESVAAATHTSRREASAVRTPA